MKGKITAILNIFITLLIVSCGSRQDYAITEIVNSINQQDTSSLENLLSYDKTAVAFINQPKTSQELIENVREAFGDIEIEGYGIFEMNVKTKHFTSYGYESKLYEAFGHRVKGSNGKKGEIFIKYCDSKGANPCFLEFRLDE